VCGAHYTVLHTGVLNIKRITCVRITTEYTYMYYVYYIHVYDYCNRAT
jgi:hypothetical protein